MAIKSILFDLDGVLLDSEGIYTDFWRDVERQYPTGIEDFALKIKGTTLPDILNTYYPADQHPGIIALLRELETTMVYRLFDGVEQMLAELKAAGYSVAIVTSSNHPKMMTIFDRLPSFGRYIDALITDEDVTHCKPHPEPYLRGAERLGVEPSECVVVEDSLNGLRSGRAAGAYVVGIPTTNSEADIAPLCDTVLADVAALPGLLATSAMPTPLSM